MAKTSYFIDAVHSQVAFSVPHLVISAYRNRFRKITGMVVLDEESPSASSVEAAVEVASIDVDDQGLRDKLLGDEFFGAQANPQMTFKSSEVTKVDAHHWKAKGDLSIHGITKPVELELEDLGGKNNPFAKRPMRGFLARGKINRGDYGMKWNVPLDTGEWYLGETVSLELQIELLRKE